MKFILELDLSKNLANFGETDNDTIARVLLSTAEVVRLMPRRATLTPFSDANGENAGFWQIKN